MAKKFLNDIDLQSHEIQTVVLENLGSPLPVAPREGRFCYSTVDKQPMFYNGSSWQYMGLVQSLSPILPITMALSAPGQYIIGIGNATTLTNGAMSAADKAKLDSLSVISSDQDVPHDPIAGGNNIITGTTSFLAVNALDAYLYAHMGSGSPASNRPHLELKQSDLDTDPTLGGGAPSDLKVASQYAIKRYVDNMIPSAIRPQVPFDPTSAAGTNDLPLSYDTPEALGGSEDILKGDQFVVTTAGTVGASLIAVNPNDLIIANLDLTADAAATQTETNWTIIAAATVLSATETVQGIAEIATQVETDAGVDDTRIVTPLKLKTYLDSVRAVIKEANNTGAGTTITVTHNFNNLNVQVGAYLNSTGESIDAVFTRTANTVQADVDASPGAWTVTVLGEDLTP